MIHKIEKRDVDGDGQQLIGSFVISSHHCWREGVYDSARTARYAFRFSDEQLKKLQDKVNSENANPDDRVITFEMLQELRRQAE